MEKQFCLIDAPWIPVTGAGRVGLHALFTHPEYQTLAGDPVQKIAVMKLLQAVAQAAATPDDIDMWYQSGWRGMVDRVCSYLEHWRDRFFLYGEYPFLQLPDIAAAAVRPVESVQPGVATGNTTLLTRYQTGHPLDDGEKALLLLTLTGFALGGKKTDNSIVLTPDYAGKSNGKGKPSTGKPGPAVGHAGMLHHFCLGTSLPETVWLNLFTAAEIDELTCYPAGTGIPPWEEMPRGEDCEVARTLKRSLMGRLIPMSRFCLLAREGLHYSEGLAHANYKEGITDPSVAIDTRSRELKVRRASSVRRPWRELPGMPGSAFDCIQIQLALPKVRLHAAPFALWSGGIQVSSNAGEQYVSGFDDMVESQTWFSCEQAQDSWLARYLAVLAELDLLSRTLYGAVVGYFRVLQKAGEAHASHASQGFWQDCERHRQALVAYCDDPLACPAVRDQFIGYAIRMFDLVCPNQTARQMDAWVRARPDFSFSLKQVSP